MSRYAGIALALLAVAAPVVAAPPPVVPHPTDSFPENPTPAEVTGNSGFEYPALSYGSWIADAEDYYANFYWQESTGCGVEIQNNVAGAPYQGAQFTEIASNCPANVYQVVTTVPGKVYTFGWAYSGRPGVQDNQVEVWFNGQSLIYLQTDSSSQGQTIWYTYTFQVVGTGSDTIRFVGHMPNDSSVGGFIDDVFLIPSGANGDPQFTGFMGQSYQVHGTSGQVYNVLSTPSFQYNALFSYLESGKARKGTQAFSHPGNYFGAVGVQIKDATGAQNSIEIVAGPVDAGLTMVVNNQTVLPSAHEYTIGAYTVSIPNQFEVLLESAEYNLRIQNSDMFLNQDVSIGTGLMSQIAAYKKAIKNGDANAAELKAALPHGILGQSWNTATYDNRWKHIEGQLFDYQVADGLMGEEFRYNKF